MICFPSRTHGVSHYSHEVSAVDKNIQQQIQLSCVSVDNNSILNDCMCLSVIKIHFEQQQHNPLCVIGQVAAFKFYNTKHCTSGTLDYVLLKFSSNNCNHILTLEF